MLPSVNVNQHVDPTHNKPVNALVRKRQPTRRFNTRTDWLLYIARRFNKTLWYSGRSYYI